MLKVEMYKLVKEDVRPWPEYLGQVLESMNDARRPIDHGNGAHGDGKVQPHKATVLAPEEAAKPENWFEVHTSLEIQARLNREYPESQAIW
jgi:hypothetical protein